MSMNPPKSTGQAMPSAIVWFGAWIVFLAVMYMISKTKSGAVVVAGLSWAAIIFLLVTHSTDISNLFTQGNLTAGQV